MPTRFRNEVQQQVKTIIARGALGTSARQASLLRYLVNQELDGSGARIKAYVIGTEVFGRLPAFDPDHDSIVRTEMARLRKALALHNATQGVGDAVTVSFSPGSFRPCIAFGVAAHAASEANPRQAVPSAILGETSDPSATFELPGRPQIDGKRSKGLQALTHLGLVLGLALIFAYAVWSQFGREPVGTGTTRIAARPSPGQQARPASRPVLMVRPVQPFDEDDARERHVAQHMTGELLSGLAGNSWLTVENPDELSAAHAGEQDYRMTLDATVDLDGQDATLIIRLRRGAGDAVIWSRRYQAHAPQTPLQMSKQLASTASSEVGRMFGPISEAYIAAAITNASTSPSAIGCTMLGYAFLRSVSRQLLDEAESCLKATLPQNTWSPELHAMLALMKLERIDFQPMTEAGMATQLRNARAHVEKARQLAPGLLIVRIAMIASDYFGDDHDRLRAELEKTIQSEPNNAVASLYYVLKTAHVLGDWDRAMIHNERAMTVMPEHPRRSRIVALQHALINNDLPRARRVVDQISTIRTPRVALARLATAGLGNDRLRVLMEKGKLAELGLTDASRMILLANSMRVAEVARPVIIDGLNKAFGLAGPR